MKGDFILRTNAAFIGKGVEEHRKWGWMIRASLDSSCAHANAVVHGDGLTSLQFRKATGDTNQEKRSSLTKADVVELERKGRQSSCVLHAMVKLLSAIQLDLDLGDEVYVGLFVCSHNAGVSEKVVFHNVRIVVPVHSTLFLIENISAAKWKFLMCLPATENYFSHHRDHYRRLITCMMANILFTTAKD